MILSLHRSRILDVKIKKPESTRAFVFEVQIGIGKASPEVDPMSGMLLNLVDVDALLMELKDFWLQQTWSSLPELLEKSQEFLETRLKTKNTFLEELCLLEKRGFWLKWRLGQRSMGREEIRELDTELYRLRWEGVLHEASLENQKLEAFSSQILLSPAIFQSHPDLFSLEVENLGSGERFVISSC